MGYASIPTDLTGYSKITGGSYAGDDSANRAIAHGLGITPIIILIKSNTNGFISINRPDGSWGCGFAAGHASGNSTAIDSTNWYASAAYHNISGQTYQWVALG